MGSNPSICMLTFIERYNMKWLIFTILLMSCVDDQRKHDKFAEVTCYDLSRLNVAIVDTIKYYRAFTIKGQIRFADNIQVIAGYPSENCRWIKINKDPIYLEFQADMDKKRNKEREIEQTP